MDEFSDIYSLAQDAEPHYPYSPEASLRRAVLEDAIVLYLGRGYVTPANAMNRRRERQRAQRWIWSQDVRWPFSFEPICHTLHVDPDALRRALLRCANTGRDGRGIPRHHVGTRQRRIAPSRAA